MDLEDNLVIHLAAPPVYHAAGNSGTQGYREDEVG